MQSSRSGLHFGGGPAAATFYHKHGSQQVSIYTGKFVYHCIWHHNPEDGILYSHCPSGDSLHC